MRLSLRSARRASRTSYIVIDRFEDVLCWTATVPGEPCLGHGERVLEVLHRLLKRVPAFDGDRYGQRTTALGDDDRVLAQLGKLVTDPVSKFGLGN